ncbi:enoyl-CoA hydratase%2C EchA4_1 [Mycobacterium tuberculosis]|nr:enoyl-CoA hydratase%2C EchA4_1 [Mycobacterium tuberculosis]
MLTGVFESLGSTVRPDASDELTLADAMERGLGDAVKDNDDKFPPEWRLSKKARKKIAKKKGKH